MSYCQLLVGQRAESPTEEGAELAEREEFIGATATEIQHHRALSEEARKVYSDLHLEEHPDSHRGERGMKAGKRKAPKPTGM